MSGKDLLEGTATELLVKLTGRTDEKIANSKTWPKSGRAIIRMDKAIETCAMGGQDRSQQKTDENDIPIVIKAQREWPQYPHAQGPISRGYVKISIENKNLRPFKKRFTYWEDDIE